MMHLTNSWPFGPFGGGVRELKQMIFQVLVFITSTSESRWKMTTSCKGAELCPLGHSLGEIKKVVVPTLANNCKF